MAERNYQEVMEKAAELIQKFNPDVVPWETSIGEWTFCFSEDLSDFLWIENVLIELFVGESAAATTDPLTAFRETFQELGRVVFKWYGQQDTAQIRQMEDANQVMGLQLAGSSIAVRLGFWGNAKFLFHQKVGKERMN